MNVRVAFESYLLISKGYWNELDNPLGQVEIKICSLIDYYGAKLHYAVTIKLH